MCMTTFSVPRSQPIDISPSTESAVYGLFAVAMALTVAGVGIGMMYAEMLFSTGIYLLLTIVEFGLILSSGFWSRTAPLNYLLFCAFPLLSGITVTPYLMMVLTGYANGGSILLNALGATTCTALAAAVVARTSGRSLQGIGGFLLFGLLGLILFGLAQVFFPSLRGGMLEIVISGGSILLFAGFTAYDLQRIQHLGRAGANPFQLALSLYLDIFNLFMAVLRFMLAVSGRRD